MLYLITDRHKVDFLHVETGSNCRVSLSIESKHDISLHSLYSSISQHGERSKIVLSRVCMFNRAFI